MKLYFMLNRRNPGAAESVLGRLFDILNKRGHRVSTGIAEEMLVRPDDLALEHDLIILKSHTELSLSLASILNDRGAGLLNPYPACDAVQDKIFGAHRLRAAGVPVPNSWVTNDVSLLASLVREHPLLVKPAHGFGGAGIRIIRQEQELASLPVAMRPNLVQEYIEGPGMDLKVYVIGGRVFAVRKPFSDSSSTQDGQAAQVNPHVEDIALRCGQAFGLGIYGVDMIESANGPIVVDVNYFPGFKGIPGIEGALADYIEAFGRGQFRLAFPAWGWPQETVNWNAQLPALR